MQRPNVLIITPHDAGRHFGCYGEPTVRTPHIDALAASGVRFTRMFATCSVCAPSRASLLTGCHPQTHGVMSLVAGCWNWELTEPRMHLSHVLRGAGYHTRMYGYQDEAADLATLGFDASSSYLGPRMPKETIDAVAMAQDVAGFLRERADREDAPPFYAQVGLFEAHTPYDYGGVPPDPNRRAAVPAYCGESSPALAAEVAHFEAAVEKADAGVGIILDALRASGLERDTLVLFAVDHGVDLPRAKRTMHDAGLGIGFILRWPGGGLAGGRECPWLLSNMDFLPTFAAWTGLQPAHRMEGVSFAAVARPDFDPSSPGPRDAVYAMWSETEEYAVRTADYKLMRKFKAEAPRPKPPGDHYALVPPVRLYHLPDDPYEQHDVSGDPAHAAALADMNRRFFDWLDAVDDPIRHGPIPTPFHRRAIADYRAARAAGR